MGIEEQLEHFNAIARLTNNTPTPFVVTVGEFVTFKHEAKVNAKKMESKRPVCASALVSPSFAYKLVADFFLRIQKPGIPYKVFSKKEEAIEWCRKFVSTVNSEEKRTH